MMLVLEILVAIVLHPIAMILSWINIAGRSDLTTSLKLVWIIVCIIPVGPIIYLLAGNGSFW